MNFQKNPEPAIGVSVSTMASFCRNFTLHDCVWRFATRPVLPASVVGSVVQSLKNSETLRPTKVVARSQSSFTQQEWTLLPMTSPEAFHIPSIRERAECLASRLKGKTDGPPKVIIMHGRAC